MLPKLNFPAASFRIQNSYEGRSEIFDVVRKKFVALTPEEWVRQHLLHFMLNHKKFPLSLLSVEKQLQLNSTLKRTDVLAYSNQLFPVFLAECKAPEISLDVKTLEQVMRYNLIFQVPFLMITNGISHFIFQRTSDGSSWLQSDDFPDYPEMLKAI